MNKLTGNSKGFIFCLLSGILYGPIGYFGISIMNANISASNMLLWRYLISSIFVLLILLIQKNSFKWNIRASIETFIAGLIFYGSCSYFYFISSIYIGSGLAMVIFFIYPVIVMVYNMIFYNSKPSMIYYISIITILFGLCLLVDFTDAKSNIVGIGLALISAAGYAGYILASKYSVSALPPLASTIIVSIGAAIASLGIACFDNSLVIPTSFEIWKNLLGLGIVSTALPILLLLKGLQYIKSEKAAILSVLEPVCTFLIGIAIMKEDVSLLQTIGVIIILGGAMLVQLDKK